MTVGNDQLEMTIGPADAIHAPSNAGQNLTLALCVIDTVSEKSATKIGTTLTACSVQSTANHRSLN